MTSKRFFPWAGALVLALCVSACAAADDTAANRAEDVPVVQAAPESAVANACAAGETYSRLKALVFDRAGQVPGADAASLDALEAASVVRMENPVTRSVDEALELANCAGRFVLELPPGAEKGFNGARRLAVDVDYSAQAATDGSGLAYRIEGADRIIGALAAFNLKYAAMPPESLPEGASGPLGDLGIEALPPDADGPESQVGEARDSRPSFSCRDARSESERMICASSSLAARDRALAGLYYSAMAKADPRTRGELRATQGTFLAYRARCIDEACIADAYEGRMREIRDILAEAR
ncbi:lysozyme inhibitor LprI family protein [Allosphingosinicella humi]